MSQKKLRSQALKIFRAALDASDPAGAILRHLRLTGDVLVAGNKKYRLSSFRRIHVIGAGKAGAAMAQAIERLLGRRIESGLINVKYGHLAKLRRIELHECGHPVPDEAGVKGADRIAARAWFIALGRFTGQMRGAVHAHLVEAAIVRRRLKPRGTPSVFG